MHSDMASLRQTNLDLCKIHSESLQTKAKPNDHPSHMSTTQANVQAGQAQQMNLFLQKEVAKLIAANKHSFDLAKWGYQDEVSRLREEIQDLTHKLSLQNPESTTQSVAHSPAYIGKIRSLNIQVSTLQAKLKASMTVNKQLQDKVDAEPLPNPTEDPQMTPAISEITNLTATVASLHLRHQADMESIIRKDATYCGAPYWIETLHAEHAHDIASTQAELKEKDDEITQLNKSLAETSDKAPSDMTAAQTAHQRERDSHSGCVPINTSTQLRAEIYNHLPPYPHFNRS